MKETKSLFKDNRLFQHSINQFLNKHHSTFAQEISKTSAFFELAVYNDIVKFYEANDYQVTPKNLKGKNEFIYALSPNAKPSNCSFFSAEKKYVKKMEVLNYMNLKYGIILEFNQPMLWMFL